MEYIGAASVIKKSPKFCYWYSLKLTFLRAHLFLVIELDDVLVEERLDRIGKRLRIVDFQVTLKLGCLTLNETVAVEDVHRGHDGSDASSPHPSDPLSNTSGLCEHLTASDNVIY